MRRVRRRHPTRGMGVVPEPGRLDLTKGGKGREDLLPALVHGGRSFHGYAVSGVGGAAGTMKRGDLAKAEAAARKVERRYSDIMADMAHRHIVKRAGMAF